MEQDAGFGPLGLQVPGECIVKGDVIAIGRLATEDLGGIASDVDQKEIELPVAVVVEEDRRRGMAGVPGAGGCRDVAEMSSPIVLEEHVAAADGRHVEVWVTVVIDVGKRRGRADAALDRHACRRRDVFKAPAPEVSPQLIAARLTEEIDVQQTVAVYVGDGDAIPMVVVRRLVGTPRVVHDAVLERDAAGAQSIGELKIMEGRHGLERLDLVGAQLLQNLQPLRISEVVWYEADTLAVAAGTTRDLPRSNGVRSRKGQRKYKQRWPDPDVSTHRKS